MQIFSQFPRSVMSTALASLMAVAATSAFVSDANAISVFPGGGVAAAIEPDPVGGTTIYTITNSFASPTLSGDLVSSVISGDTSNPYGLSSLTFTYYIVLSALSPDAASALSIASFLGFQTDMSYSGAGVAPQFFSRSGDGEVVRFSFILDDINPGQTSALLVVQTDAVNYDITSAGILDGQPASVTSLAPLTVVPEPTTFALLLPGLLALRLIKRRNA
jgi:hypothetical protein